MKVNGSQHNVFKVSETGASKPRDTSREKAIFLAPIAKLIADPHSWTDKVSARIERNFMHS